MVQRKLYVSPSYLKTHNVIKHPDELSEEACLTHLSSSPRQAWIFKNNYMVPISSKYTCNSVVSLVEAAKKGLGYIYMTRHNVVSALEKGDLIEVLPEFAGTPQDIALYYPNGQFIPKKVRVFIDFIKTHYAKKF